MSEEIAQKAITEVNELGQTVVVVQKGMPIPKHLQASAKKVAAPAEDKARRGPRKKADS
jgi:serine kinase of HPr protein (carbohydrate metabolism regulator)